MRFSTSTPTTQRIQLFDSKFLVVFQYQKVTDHSPCLPHLLLQRVKVQVEPTRSATTTATLRAEPLFSLLLSGQETEKEALHKSASAFEVAVAPTFGLVIPVYCRQTGFSSASINFYEKPMVETEPTGCKEKHGGERAGERRSCGNA